MQTEVQKSCSLRSGHCLVRNARKYIEFHKNAKEIELEKIYRHQQNELFTNINNTNHDFSKTLELCKLILKNKIEMKQALSMSEVQNLYKQLSYCSRLITDFKDLATPLRGRERVQDLEELLQSLNLEQNKRSVKEKKLNVVLNLNDALLLKLDDGFERVFHNIISNAIERMTKNEFFYINQNINENTIYFSFKNTGSFASKENLSHILKPFRVCKKSSSKSRGNGLTIANEIVKAHNGTIVIDSSEEEKWFEVKVTLPIKVLINE